MAFPKHNYDGEEFYQQIYSFAMNGATDEDIACLLEPSLTPEVFCRMKNGNYEGWTEEENKERSAHISQVLTRARRKINMAVRSKWLQMALGQEKIKSVVERSIREEDGTETGQMLIQTTTTDVPANHTALVNWMMHHDPEFRKEQDAIRKGEVDDDKSNIDAINVSVTYNERAHLDLQEKEDGE